MNALARKDDDDQEGDDLDPREAHAVRLELLRVLHADGEARTRRSDKGKTLLESAVPFIIGVLIGVLGTLAAFSGRMATLEAVQQQQAEASKESRAALNELLTYVRAQPANGITPRR